MTSFLVGLRCVSCGASTTDRTRDPLCPACGGFLQAEYDLEKLRAEVDRDALAVQPPGMWRWSCLLPVRDERHVVTLQEGDTPLLRMGRLEAEFGGPRFFIKDESRNPSGSFKDRGASVTAGKCREVGIEHLIIASSGNASAAMSAYCARAGLQLTALMRPQTVTGHLLQNLICGTNAMGGGRRHGGGHPAGAAGRQPPRLVSRRAALQPVPHRRQEDTGVRGRRGARLAGARPDPDSHRRRHQRAGAAPGFQPAPRPRLGRPHAGAGRGAIHRLCAHLARLAAGRAGPPLGTLHFTRQPA